jgi:capsular polysaccharide export protein
VPIPVTAPEQRSFLFLQGAPNRFARRLGDELEGRGHRVLRINLCIGDWWYWRGRPAVNYRGRLADWEGYLRALIEHEGVTDLLYYADRLPYHRVAIRVGEELGLYLVTYELGYLRPDWITLERRGMSSQSHFPTDPKQVRTIARQAPPPDLTPRYRFTFFQEAYNDVLFNLSNFFLFFLYPFYDADKHYNRLIEYLSYIPRLLAKKRNNRRARVIIDRLVEDGTPFFVFPLQMQNDYQIRAHSPYRHLSEAIDEVINSFAQHAGPAERLVFKVHPADNGLENWRTIIAVHAKRAGIDDRVSLIDGGDLMKLLRGARGAVLVNSTVGLHAMQAGCPVKVLGTATFDIAGLTHSGPLADFWAAPTKPDPALCDDLVRALAATIQVKGNLYTDDGLTRAVPEVADRLIARTVNEPGGFVDPPPRLDKARAMGVLYVDNED